MELMLVGVSALSFAIASGMSLIAWKLLREQDARSAARVSLLHASAAEPEGAVADDGLLIEIEPAADIDHADVLTSPLAPAIASFDDDPWDFKRLDGSATSTQAPARQPGRTGRAAPPLPAHLFEPPVHVGAGSLRRGLTLAVVAAIMAVGVGTVYALRDGRSLPSLASFPSLSSLTGTATPATAAGALELLTLDHATGETGVFTVSGLVENPSPGREMHDVDAVIYLFDAAGDVVATGRAAIDRSMFRPGQQSAFVVRIPTHVEVTRYRVGFRLKNDAVVSHVDRRGAPPAGATGARFDGSDRRQPAAAPPLGPRRTEG
jgi:hypothetical protein